MGLILPVGMKVISESRLKELQDNLNINEQLIDNIVHLLYSNMNRSCLGHPLYDLSQDKQLSGLQPQS